jgi:hypothetical protein
MKKMKKIITYAVAALLISLGAAQVQAQEGVRLTLGYNINMPSGTYKEYLNKNSYRGFSGEITYPLNASLRLGLGVAHSDYYEKTSRQLYDSKEGTVSAVRTRSIQTSPILAKLNYNLMPAAAIQPYVNVGAGFNLISFGEYLGAFENNTHTAFKPALNAGVGLNIPFRKETGNSGINLGGSYNFMPFNYAGVKNLNNWGAHLGVYFPLK